MALNASDAFNSPLEIFASLYEDMNPQDLPPGLSPANQDCWYLPGSVQTRPALSRLLPAPIAGDPLIMSIAVYPNPLGGFVIIFLDSAGTLWQYDPVAQVTTQLSTVTSGTQFQAEAAFDKLWMTGYGKSPFTNPFVGTDVPRYYDGKNVWRVTQDAPGAGVTASDLTATYSIVASPGGVIVSTASSGVASLTETGNIVTLKVVTPFFASFPLQVGDYITVNTGTAYDGTFQLTGVSTDQSTLQYILNTTGLGPVTSGNIFFTELDIVLTQPPTFGVGQLVTLSGVTNAVYDQTYEARQVFVATNTVRVAAGMTFASSSGGGTLAVAGSVTAGVHGVVVMFKSVNGAITGPSLPVFWNSVGNVSGLISNIPIGPPGTVARIIALTPAGGASYFYTAAAFVPPTANSAAIMTTGTILNDNTSTTFQLNVSDAQLLAGIEIDIDGNNLFNQIVLAPCLFVKEYQSRLFWGGEINNIKNLVNMGFDGGYTGAFGGLPLGWSNFGTTGGTGQLQMASPSTLGFQYGMTSAGGANDCMLQQDAYQDYYGAPILQPNTNYAVRCLAQRSIHSFPVSGALFFEFYSPSQGSLAQASFLAQGIATANQQWLYGNFALTTPASIPSDTVFRFWLNGVNSGITISVDELHLVNADQPVLNHQVRASYVNNPFGYDSITGLLAFDRPNSATAAFQQRGYLYFNTDGPLVQTQNNGIAEPAGNSDGSAPAWNVIVFAENCDCAGPNAVAVNEDTAVWAGRSGVRLFAGSEPKKLSQEIQPTWDTINWASITSLWAVNDPLQRIVYFGLPTLQNTAPASVMSMSYRAVDSAYNVPDPLHISYSGKLIDSDLSRKWSPWNIFANAGAMCRLGTAQQMVFAGGNGSNAGLSFGQLYTLTFAQQHDDDYGVIPGNKYTTYAHWNHDIEQSAPNLGLHRKVYTYLSEYVTGVGQVQVTPLVDSLSNPWPTLPLYQLSTVLKFDLEWPLNVVGDRVFFQTAAIPLPGSMDASFNLQHMVVAGRMDKIFPVRGAVL